MRTLAIDYGTRRIGVAITDPGGSIAMPLESIERRGSELERIEQLVRSNDVSCVVVGLPIHMNGSEADAGGTRAFADSVRERTGVTVEFVDERWTSVEAERLLSAAGVRGRRRRRSVDPIAAALILQTWLARRAT